MNYPLILCLILIKLLIWSNANDFNEVKQESEYYDGSDEDITAGPPSYDKPWVPAWGFFEGYNTSWRDRHLELLNQTQKNGKNIKVVFLGDSLTDYFTTNGKDIWDTYYGNTGVYNYGIGGDSTREILWRIQHQEFDGMSPKLLTLMIGTNNLNEINEWHPWVRGTDDEIVKAIQLILDSLHQKLPNTTILLLGILPQGSEQRNARIRNINKQISKFKDNKVVYYLDMSSHYFKYYHGLNPSLYLNDSVHPNRAGYFVWVKAMEYTYKMLLNK